MDIEIGTSPEYRFQITAEQVAVLTKLAASHYDSVCKGTTLVGGFIYGWNNAVNFSRKGKTTHVSASWDELDIALKVLEQEQLMFRELTVAERSVIYELRRDFHGVLEMTTRAMIGWKARYTAPAKVSA